MDFLESLVLGIVEGLTEFLPVSSTFHLIWAGKFLGVGDGEFVKLFHIFIQSGAILAVLLMYRKNLRKDVLLVKKTLAAFLPTALLGVIAYTTIKQVFFEAPVLMSIVFFLVGFLFLGFEVLVKKGVLEPRRPLSDLTYRNAVLIGIFQALAFLPGVSRAGAVILAMMILGFRRDEAAVFSFLLAIPTIVSAAAYDLYKTWDVLSASASNLWLLAAGFVVSFAVAYLAVKWLIRYLQHHSLNLFGFYRLAVGAILLLILLF